MDRSVGIDIGHSRVKAVVLQHRGGRLDVVDCIIVPAGVPSAVAGQLRGFLAENEALGYPCELCFSASYWRMRRIELAERRGLLRHLRDVVRSELEDELEGDPERWIVDACPIEREGGTVSVLAFAAKQEQVAIWIEALESAGIRLSGLYPDALCLEAALRAFGWSELVEQVLVCDLGAASAKLLWFRHGKLNHAALVPYDSSKPELLRTAGTQVGLALAGRIEDQLCVRTTGGLSRSDEICSAFVDGLSSVLSLDKVAELGAEHLVGTLEPELLCAAGAATKQWESPELRVDLRRGSLADPRRTRQLVSPLVAAALLLAAGLGLLGLSLSSRAASAQARGQSAQAEVRQIWRELYPETPIPPFVSGRLTSERIRLEGLAGQHGSVPKYRDLLEVLRQAFEHMPDGTRLFVSSVNLGQETATLKGEVASHSLAQQLAESLETSPELVASPPATAQLPMGAVSFDVTLSYKGQQGQVDAP